MKRSDVYLLMFVALVCASKGVKRSKNPWKNRLTGWVVECRLAEVEREELNCAVEENSITKTSYMFHGTGAW